MTDGFAEEGWTDAAWRDAGWAAALFAVDPPGTGVALRALAGPVRVRWLALLRRLLPDDPMRTVPLNIVDARLLGGLDLAATLQAGRPVAARGLLAEADGGTVLLAMAERLSAGAAARIAAVMDGGAAVAARLGVVALDEGMAEDERAPGALRDRLAFAVDLAGIGARVADGPLPGAEQVAAARLLLPRVHAEGDVIEGLCETAVTLQFKMILALVALVTVVNGDIQPASNTKYAAIMKLRSPDVLPAGEAWFKAGSHIEVGEAGLALPG